MNAGPTPTKQRKEMAQPAEIEEIEGSLKGTTIFALRCGDGFILASDSRARNIFGERNDVQKMVTLERSFVLVSGVSHMARWLLASAVAFDNPNVYVSSMLDYLVNLMKKNRVGHYGAIVGGFEANGQAKFFSLEVNEGRVIMKRGDVDLFRGSGGPYAKRAITLARQVFSHDLPEEGVQLACLGMGVAMNGDGATGGLCTIKHFTANGVQHVSQWDHEHLLLYATEFYTAEEFYSLG